MTAPAEPVWLDRQAVLNAHELLIQLTGGAPGARDQALLDSALGRPANRYHYEGEVDLCLLAATYGVGVAMNHPFVDGNKRAAFMCVNLFLEANGRSLTASESEAADVMWAVAGGGVDINELAAWIRANLA